MKTREEHDAAFRVVRAAIASWDPYRMLGGGAPKGEWDHEIARRLPRIKMRQHQQMLRARLRWRSVRALVGRLFSEKNAMKWQPGFSATEDSRTTSIILIVLNKSGLSSVTGRL